MSELAVELTDLIKGLADSAPKQVDGQLHSVWPTIMALGLPGIGIEDAAGGSGGSLSDLIVVIRELARAGIATPIVEASAAAFAIGVAAPGTFDTVVIDPSADTSSGTIDADLDYVAFATHAQRLVVVGDNKVVAVRLDRREVTSDGAVDVAGLPYARVRLRDAACEPLERVADATEVVEHLALARCSALLGSACAAHELTQRYIDERQQFGAPLSRIAAVVNTSAEMAIAISTARSAIERAAASCVVARDESPHRFGAIASARVAAAQMGTFVAAAAHQLHGAMGVTREYGLHSHTTRLWAWRDADGTQQQWSRRLGAAVINGDEATLWNDITA